MGGRREALREAMDGYQWVYTKHMLSHAEPRGTAEEPREALGETKSRCRGTSRNRGRNREFLEEALREMVDRCRPAFF